MKRKMNGNTPQALIVFVRTPEPGKVKTRLAATIGDAAALQVYIRLLEHTRHISELVDAGKFIFYAGDIKEPDMWTGKGYYKRTQAGGDLGNRMQQAFRLVLSGGYTKVLIIGSDCLELSAEVINKGFAQLEEHDVVIGPAADGGYYLLGMKRLYPQLFSGINWSTSTVYAETLAAINQLALTYAVLPTLSDIDEEKDLPAAWLQNT